MTSFNTHNLSKNLIIYCKQNQFIDTKKQNILIINNRSISTLATTLI